MSSQLAALNEWVDAVAKLTQPDRIHWCDGSDAESAALIELMLATGDLIKLNEQTHPELLPAPLEPVRRGARRAPDLRVHASREDAGPNNHWMAPAEAHAQDGRAVRRLHARPHAVRDPVLHGPDRFAAVALRRRDHRLAVRGRQHAHHDAHGRAGAGAHRARGHVRARPAFDRRARSRPPLHHAFPGRADASRASAPATAATPCWARSATRCASPPTRRAAKAGWPSTC